MALLFDVETGTVYLVFRGRLITYYSLRKVNIEIEVNLPNRSREVVGYIGSDCFILYSY